MPINNCVSDRSVIEILRQIQGIVGLEASASIDDLIWPGASVWVVQFGPERFEGLSADQAFYLLRGILSGLLSAQPKPNPLSIALRLDAAD